MTEHSGARHGPARLLIADDSPDLLQALKETLQREGFVVTAVENDEAALASIRADPPDIAVLDLRMPKLDGFAVCRTLRANPLTRLPGNLSIELRVDRAIKEGLSLAVLYIDLNQFKAYNDAYGYDEGDRVIKGLARVLVDQIGKGADFVGHIGGNDFIVLSSVELKKAAKTNPGSAHVVDRRKG